MKRLELPHQLADYLCPVNGLCDVYEWKTDTGRTDFLFQGRLSDDFPEESSSAKNDFHGAGKHWKAGI